MPKQDAATLKALRDAKKARGYALAPGRPTTPIPPDAAERIRSLAAQPYTKQGVAMKLGIAGHLFKKWLDENPELKEAYDAGQAELESKLMHVLFTAGKKNWVAALALGKVKFGWREGEQRDASSRVNVVFNLPGARKAPEPLTIENNDGQPDLLALPKPRPR